MKRLALAGCAIVGLAAWSQTADASGDYGCAPTWSLSVSSYDCAGTALIGPRNDTRMNLALLLRDRAAAKPVREGVGAPAYPKWDWDSADYGHVFVSWDVLQAAFWPQDQSGTPASDDETAYAGSRCQTLASGGAAFRTALAAAKGLKPDERAALASARDLVKPACDGDKGAAAWPDLPGKAAQAWLGYLQGARAFYADDFATARTRFADLAKARDPWLMETGRYMVARTELAAALASAIDEWGGFAGSAKVDRPAAERARTALAAYIAAYPRGRYTASAAGLTRRAAWLLGDGTALARTYSNLLADPARSPAMLEEVESKLFFGAGLGTDADAPLLTATWDLLRMRQKSTDPYASNDQPAMLTEQDLASQAGTFAKQPDLYGFLQASLAYHVAKDYRRVVTLIPADAHARGYTPLAFSRQMLRALALDKLGDPSATDSLRFIAANARDLYQQPAAQLALAMEWERGGRLADVFAPGSPITEPEIRTILLARIAGPDLLRRQATAQPTRQVERNVAGFTLLAKELSRGRYSDFVRDVQQVPATAPVGDATSGSVGEGWNSSWMDPSGDNAPPVGLFARGKWQEGFPCPALARTAAQLANRPTAGARLCLAEFWRLNDFDAYLAASRQTGADELGGTAELFPGTAMPRAALYAAVLADKTATPDQTAYALYRSVRCYAPSRNNACGGKDVPESQRKAWFQRLKRDYATSKWAADLPYYW